VHATIAHAGELKLISSPRPRDTASPSYLEQCRRCRRSGHSVLVEQINPPRCQTRRVLEQVGRERPVVGIPRAVAPAEATLVPARGVELDDDGADAVGPTAR
jgi:hypothetical protein